MNEKTEVIKIGCDIHPYLEVKIEGQWVFMGQLDADRNYVVFGMLSGVRGNEERYFPEFNPATFIGSAEINDMLKSWDLDGHSHTVVYLNHIHTWIEEKDKDRTITDDSLHDLWREGDKEAYHHRSKKAMFFVNSWLDLMDELVSSTKMIEDARVVLWYDN